MRSANGNDVARTAKRGNAMNGAALMKLLQDSPFGNSPNDQFPFFCTNDQSPSITRQCQRHELITMSIDSMRNMKVVFVVERKAVDAERGQPIAKYCSEQTNSVMM